MAIELRATHFRPITTVAATIVLISLTGCQKRCNDWNLGWVKLGMHQSYTPGPVPLLDETIFQYKGPAYPQKSIPKRIEDALLKRFPAGSSVAPLIANLQTQHFVCTTTIAANTCHLKVTTSVSERCSILDDTTRYKLNETIDVLIDAHGQRINKVSVKYDINDATDARSSGRQAHAPGPL